jgi:sterol-4alpha-carboxylate 3-dehydrogenase (decarboxylating)
MEKAEINILITGGSGFLGRTIVNELLEPSLGIKVRNIRILDIRIFPEELPEKASIIEGDVRNYESVREACKGMDVVIHSAAIVDWGTKSEKEVYDVNYTGTKNVIRACRENKIGMLVYTSSLDTVIHGKPLRNINEKQPYPEKHLNMYCKSKYLAEKLIIETNSPGLRTVALRPSDIYGENDPYHIMPLINMAKGGFYLRIGNGKAKCQHVYVGNIAYAHVQAVKALVENNGVICGKAYFITDGEGTNFFTFFDRIVTAAGYRIWPRNLWLPKGIAYAMGIISEFFALLVRPIKYYNPKMSRFAVMYTCTDFTFSAERARADFNFSPKYTEQEAFDRTVESFRNK